MKNSSQISAWEKVEIARNPRRKTAIDYIEKIFDEFIELHGDRNFKDDKAIICGLAKIACKFSLSLVVPMPLASKF